MQPGQSFVSALPDRNHNADLFECLSKKSFRNIYFQGIEIMKEVDVVKMMVHRKSLHYLDIAVKPCIHSLKRDHFKHEIMRDLPLAVAEYLIAETEIYENNKLNRLFQEVDKFQKSLVNSYQINQNAFARKLYYEFHDAIFNKFEGLDRSQRRTSIRAILKLHKIFGLCRFTFSQFMSLIRECTSPVPDPALTIELLSILRNLDLQKKKKTFDEIPHEFFETLLCYAEVVKFDFWGLWQGIGQLSAEFNPVVKFIIDRKYLSAAILMKYGFPFSCKLGIYQRQRFLFFLSSATIVTRYPVFPQLLQKQCWNRIIYILIAFMAFVDFDRTGHISTDSILMLVCLMRCEPEPLVVPSEIVLKLSPIIIPTQLGDFFRICRKYASSGIFDESYTIYKPRRLKHLCRCTIRRVIGNNLRLPEGIDELEVPELVKAYLSLKC